MGAAYFYHLTQRPLEAALPMLIERALAAGWRVAVRGTDAARMEWLDARLWTGPDEQFIPHGLAGGPHDELQPVLLTTGRDSPNRAACLMAVDGAEVSVDETSGYERICILFDGADETALAGARAQWKALTDAGVPAIFWSEASGRWEKKAET